VATQPASLAKRASVPRLLVTDTPRQRWTASFRHAPRLPCTKHPKTGSRCAYLPTVPRKPNVPACHANLKWRPSLPSLPNEPVCQCCSPQARQGNGGQGRARPIGMLAVCLAWNWVTRRLPTMPRKPNVPACQLASLAKRASVPRLLATGTARQRWTTLFRHARCLPRTERHKTVAPTHRASQAKRAGVPR